MTTGKDVAPAGILRDPDHPPYITIARAGSGWDAIMFWWNPENGGYWQPWTTSTGRWVSAEAAAHAARNWAQVEAMPFRPEGEQMDDVLLLREVAAETWRWAINAAKEADHHFHEERDLAEVPDHSVDLIIQNARNQRKGKHG